MMLASPLLSPSDDLGLVCKRRVDGDIRVRGTTHVCNGCCAGAADAASKMWSLFSDLFFADVDTMPSTNKWYTFEPALVSQTGLLAIHDLGAQAAQVTFDAGGIDDDADDDNDDFHKTASKKNRQRLTDKPGWWATPQTGKLIKN